MGYVPRAEKLVSHTDVLRHDPARLAEAIFRIIL
jgi:hypothetical protein